MPGIRETISAALHARLQTLAATVLRGDVLPERIPAEGLIILRAGRLAERLATSKKANAIQRHMPDAAARRPRDRDDLAQRMRDGGFDGGRGVGPPVVVYSRAEQMRAAPEIEAQPEGAVVTARLSDHASGANRCAGVATGRPEQAGCRSGSGATRW